MSADAEAIAGDFIEQARAAATRGEDVQVLGMAHLRTALTLFALVNPIAGEALAEAVRIASEMLGRVATLARNTSGDTAGQGA